MTGFTTWLESFDEGHALVKACADSPRDNTPMAAYADWLDENGGSPWTEILRCRRPFKCRYGKEYEDDDGNENFDEEPTIRTASWGDAVAMITNMADFLSFFPMNAARGAITSMAQLGGDVTYVSEWFRNNDGMKERHYFNLYHPDTDEPPVGEINYILMKHAGWLRNLNL